MASHELIFTDKFESQLREWLDYITEQAGSSKVASRLLSKLDIHLENLRSFPECGRLLDEEPYHELGFRKLVVENLLVYYVVEEDRVVLLYIIDGRMDQTSQLKDLEIL